MDKADPFSSVVELCQISSSQLEQLSRCRFVGEPDNESLSDDESGGIPVESTGIVILSLPDSPVEQENDVSVSRDNDIFHTPPEESSLAVSQDQQEQKNVAVDSRDDCEVEGLSENGKFAAVDRDCVDDERAVDLWMDTDPGFYAEGEVTERIETDSGSQSSYDTNQINGSKVFHFESINYGIEEVELNESDGLGETPAKILKIADRNLGLSTPEPSLGSDAARTLERVAKYIEKLKSPSKFSKKLDGNVALESPRNTSGIKTSNFLNTDKKLSFEDANPQKCLNSLQNHQNKNAICFDKQFQGDECVKRTLLFYSKTLLGMKENEAVSVANEDRVEGDHTKEIEEESEMEDNEAVSAVDEDRIEGQTETEEIDDVHIDRLCNDKPSYGANSRERLKDRVSKSIDDIDKFRYVRPTGANSPGKHKNLGVKRALPVSLLGSNSNVRGEVVPNGVTCEVSSTVDNKEITVLDVLREIAKDYTCDPGLAKLSVLEAARRGGMTFP